MSRKSKYRFKPRKRHVLKKIIKWLFFFVLVLMVSCSALALCGFTWFEKETGMTVQECYEYAQETIQDSSTSDFTLNQKSIIYDNEGEIMAVLSSGDTSTYLEYDDIPEYVINAFIAVEDQSFWENPGFDIKGIIRAAVSDLKNGSASQGASTITQQLCKLTYLSSEKSVERKAKEILLAAELTKKYGKEQIMEWYANSICFANGIYGIEDAAQSYFGKSASELSLAETAYLCAIPNRPEYYNPWKDPDAAVSRQRKILGNMLECDFITQDEYDQAMVEDIEVIPSEDDLPYTYAVSYAISCAVETIMGQSGFEFVNEFGTNDEYEAYQEEYETAYAEAKDKLYTGGYEVYTSIDQDAQGEIQDILDEGLAYDTAMSDTGIYNLQGAVTVINNDTGKVVAIIGGRTQEGTSAVYGYNRAFQYARQPGSTVKPLLAYIPALESGYTADTKVKNVDVQKAYAAYKDGGDVTALSGTYYTIRYSVEHSLNGAALYVYSEVGTQEGIGRLLSMGFSHIVPDDYYLSAVLGGFTYGTNTLEMANAYSTIANYGEYTKADCIVSMLDSDGNEVYGAADTSQVYESDACIEITDIMQGVLTTGTASGISWSDYTDEPAAGKTGTTNDTADGWFVGYTDDYTVAVWVGNDDNTTVEDLYGGTVPAEIWRDSMLWLLKNKPVEIENSIFEATPEEDENNEEYEIWHTNQAGYARSGPGKSYGVVYTLSANTDVILVEYGEYWSEIIVDGTTCYIYSPFLSEGSVENH